MSTFALIGKPNCGKTLLFNRLTGLRQKVANYPGVTVSTKEGQYNNHTLLDFPGIYSLQPITEDEKVAVDQFTQSIKQQELDGIVVILDGTRLEISLTLALEIQQYAHQYQIPVLFAINMLDVLKEHHIDINIIALSEALHTHIHLFSAKTGENTEALQQWLQNPTVATLESLDYPDDLPGFAQELSLKYASESQVLIQEQNRFDQFLLSGFWGGSAFFLIMLVLFQSIFTWAAPFMDLIDGGIGYMAEVSTTHLSKGTFRSFIEEAVFGGIGAFVIFVPQIFFLTFLIGLLEDSGYMARMAVICHRPLQFFGLSGKSVVPLLTGHACAIPAIYAARTIESPKKRFLTILVTPLISCSARLPVYGLLIAVSIPSITLAGGLIGLQGLIFFLLYFLGIAGALLVAALTSKVQLNKDDPPFFLELPAYRLPAISTLIRDSARSAWRFISQAGGLIFTVNTIIWVLGYFPNGEGQLQSSYLAQLGHIFEPMFAPLGLDWKFAVAILMSFLAREVFVGALGTMMGLEDSETLEVNLAEKLQQQGMTLGSSLALMMFYVFAMQCVSTLAVMRQELGNNKAPIWIFVGYNLGAYVLALLVYYAAALF